MTTYRRRLKKHQLLDTKFAIKSSLPIKAKFVGGIVEDARRRSILVSSSNSPPIKRCCQNTIPYIRQAISRNHFFSAMPRSILRVFDLKKKTSHLNRMSAQTESVFLFFSFFHASYGRFFIFIFSDRYIGHIMSLGQKKKRQAFHWLFGAYSTSSENFVKLSRAEPIHRSGSGLAGPARNFAYCMPVCTV